jgi:hypothetical protein
MLFVLHSSKKINQAANKGCPSQKLDPRNPALDLHVDPPRFLPVNGHNTRRFERTFGLKVQMFGGIEAFRGSESFSDWARRRKLLAGSQAACRHS